MPDTKVSKTANGWIDHDDPGTYYRVRRLAREARRARRVGQIKNNQPQVKGIRVQAKTARQVAASLTPINTKVTIVGLHNDGQVALTTLQSRLLDRLTNKQGVSYDDAMDIILNNGYNKAASYGHMRAAGANHSEAQTVIGLDSPQVSVAYGKARAAGKDHAEALGQALHA